MNIQRIPVKSRYAKDEQSKFDATFLAFAYSKIKGIPNSKLVEIFAKYAEMNHLSLPHTQAQSWNKQEGFLANLAVFDDSTKFTILEELSENGSPINRDRKDFKNKLYEKFGYLNTEGRFEVFSSSIKETQHFLEKYPNTYETYNRCVAQFSSDSKSVHLLDDLRKSLEFLMQEILNKSGNLENLYPEFQKLSKINDFTVEFRSMLYQLVDYFTKYQNSNVKYKENIKENEIEFVFELTTTFLRFYATNFVKERL